MTTRFVYLLLLLSRCLYRLLLCGFLTKPPLLLGIMGKLVLNPFFTVENRNGNGSYSEFLYRIRTHIVLSNSYNG